MEKQSKDIGRLLSFHNMLDDQQEVIHKVLIPKIQRDYAQGRNGMEALRQRFLKSIFEVIDNRTDKELMLDFVFGQKEESTKNTFFPVDGQQRLTTLFLIHLYVGKMAGVSTGLLKKFSYETRTSSKQFCERLHDIPSESYKGIKDFIEKQWWYTGLWKTDPTIKAMINMLHDIDCHYQAIGYSQEDFINVWERLKRNVKFWLLYLSDLNTTDELYIKMNSRGKPLTDFEHFKAMLDEYAHTNGELSNKIDTRWTKLLWRYRDASQDLNPEKYVDNGLDQCFYNLLLFYLNIEGSKRGLTNYEHPETNILVLADKVLGHNKQKGNEYAAEKERDTKEIMDRFTRILDFFSSQDENEDYINDPTTFFKRYLQHDYTEWSSDKSRFTMPETVKVFTGKTTEDGLDLLKQICSLGKIENKAALYAEAFFQYASSPSSDFLNRLRQLRNLVENTEIHARAFRENLLVVDELIANGNLSIDGVSDEFNQSQKRQEVFKEAWLTKHPEKANLLKLVENHWLLMGNLNVVIKRNDSMDEIDETTLDNICHLFHSNCDYEKIQLALLSYGDYSPLPNKNKVRPYGGREWRRWRDLTQSFNQATPSIVQAFLKNEPLYDTANLDKIVDLYLASEHETYNWPYYLVKYPEIRSARYAKYRYLNGHYTHTVLNANGGGGPEMFWNPYNKALGTYIQYANTVDYYGGPMTLTDANIQVNILEHHIEFKFPDQTTQLFEIPSDAKTGLDIVDRIEFAIKTCESVLQNRIE